MSSKAPGRSIGILLGVLALLFIPFDRSRRASAAEELGTVGIAAVQLYTDAQPNKRGVLMVRRVEPGSAAGDAGIRLGDIIISVNGSAIEGRDSSQIAQNDFRGPVGGAVRMKIARLDGSQSEIMLTRKPFPPHINPASDPFKYVVPGSWGMDLRYKFPLPWSPAISHQGLEDLAFAPNFADQSSPDYHSYLILWWLDGAPQITAEQLQTDIVVYFRGLAEQRGRNNHFVPDLSKISAEYNEAGQKPQTLGACPRKCFAALSPFTTPMAA
jgi:hypothetical protein